MVTPMVGGGAVSMLPRGSTVRLARSTTMTAETIPSKWMLSLKGGRGREEEKGSETIGLRKNKSNGGRTGRLTTDAGRDFGANQAPGKTRSRPHCSAPPLPRRSRHPRTHTPTHSTHSQESEVLLPRAWPGKLCPEK